MFIKYYSTELDKNLIKKLVIFFKNQDQRKYVGAINIYYDFIVETSSYLKRDYDFYYKKQCSSVEEAQNIAEKIFIKFCKLQAFS